MEIKLNEDEIDLLRYLLNNMAFRPGTGEVGIMHGQDRFVSNGIILKKRGVEVLEKLAAKIGAPPPKRVK